MTLLTALQLEALFIVALLLPLLLQLVALYLTSRALWTFTGRYFGRLVWALFALVGVPLHELSHAFAFFITGAGVQRMVLFAPRGLPEYNGATGVVVPRRKPSGFSRLVSSIAPFFGCSLAAWLALRLLLPGFEVAHDIPALDFAAVQNGGLGQAAGQVAMEYLRGLVEAFTRLEWLNWRTWLAIYLGASLGMGAAPSKEDFKLFFPALLGLLVLLLPVFALLQALSNPQTAFTVVRDVAGSFLVPLGAALSYATIFAVLVLAVLVLLLPLRRLRR